MRFETNSLPEREIILKMSSDDAGPVIIEVGSPSKGTADSGKKGRKSGKRISELQKRFVSTGESKTVDMKDVSMSRSATMEKVYLHEVKVWLEKNVVASRDF